MGSTGVNTAEHFDVLIVGSGLSGIGAACMFKKAFGTEKKMCILEGRSDLGGTWDLFRYPGIRSDSDMYTFAFSFRPWTNHKQSMANGDTIKNYLKETAQEYGIDTLIRYQHKVKKCSWSSEDCKWTIYAESGGEPVTYTANFLFSCCGYYRYEAGYTPDWESLPNYKGTVIHPQHWPEGYDVTNKKVVVIGSGATAVSLIPALAPQVSHVTMLQRSPSYVARVPRYDPKAQWLFNLLPFRLAAVIARWKNIYFSSFIYWMSRNYPQRLRARLLGLLGKDLDAEEIKKNFSPTYNVWDQRLCAVADGDLFDAIKSGKASVVTDHIDHFEEDGIALKSGKKLEADVIVTATGLVVQVNGGILLEVDGKPIESGNELIYRGLMYSDVPNAAFATGYTNASWTLKVELIYDYLIDLFRYMDKNGIRKVTPARGSEKATRPTFDLDSNYIKRAHAILPKQGETEPWITYQNYRYDTRYMRFTDQDGVLQFSK